MQFKENVAKSQANVESNLVQYYTVLYTKKVPNKVGADKCRTKGFAWFSRLQDFFLRYLG